MVAQGLDWNRILEIGRGLGQQLPHGTGIVAVWPWAALLVVSLIVGLHGERLVRVLVLGGFVMLAGLLGRRVAEMWALPFWPTLVLMGAIGGIVAFLFYRWALGLALAAALAATAGAWSLGTHLDSQDIRAFFSDVQSSVAAGNTPQETATPAALAVRAMHCLDTLWQRGAQLWTSLANAPAARKHLMVMVLAGAAVGLLAGLVFGRLAAIAWTSLLAAGGLVVAGVSLATHVRPQWAEGLSDNRRYVLIAGAAVALLFMLRQVARGRPGTTVVAAPAPVAPSADKS